MPLVKRLQKTYKGNDKVRIYGVNVWDKRDKAMATVKKMGLTYTQLMVGDEVAKAYGVQGIPSVFVIGADGKLLVVDGSAEQGAEAIESALKNK